MASYDYSQMWITSEIIVYELLLLCPLSSLINLAYWLRTTSAVSEPE